MRRYIWNLLRAADIFANTLIGGKVRTISARLGQGHLDGSLNWLEKLIYDGLELGFPGHCRESYDHWEVFVELNGQEYELRKVEEPSEIHQRGVENTPTTGGSTARNTGGIGD